MWRMCMINGDRRGRNYRNTCNIPTTSEPIDNEPFNDSTPGMASMMNVVTIKKERAETWGGRVAQTDSRLIWLASV
jgi:hypothetical protein